MSRVDELLASAGTSDAAALERMRGALKAEAAKPMSRSWKGDAVLVLAAAWGAAVATAAFLIMAGQSGAELLAQHRAALAWILVTGGFAAWAAMAPPRRLMRVVAAVGVVAAPVGLVLLRLQAGGATSAQPPWVCTVSHLAVGLLPLLVGLAMLRRSAPSMMRGLLCGIAAGTAGALVGEIGCGQDGVHVALFHVSAWVAIAVVCALAARRGKRSSYAP